jgi:hypothetical protein
MFSLETNRPLRVPHTLNEEKKLRTVACRPVVRQKSRRKNLSISRKKQERSGVFSDVRAEIFLSRTISEDWVESVQLVAW